MTDSLHNSLLLTKLNRPQLSRELLSRPRLLDQLQSPSSLVLVVAPAGYGKTTLVDSWLENSSTPSAWLALDESDNDLYTFVHYLVAAVQTRFPLFGNKTLQLLSEATSLSTASVSHSLINDLSLIEGDFVLVLDDYHFIHKNAIHKLLTDLLRHPLRNFHLVLATRHDPPLPLPALRSRGLVTELRAADLRFTINETAEFFKGVLHFKITDQDIAILADKSEGWPVSLRLAAIYFQHSGSSSLVKANQEGHNRYLVDYMVTEITSRLSKEVKEFLMKTSILDQLCEPLCDAVMGYGIDSDKSRKHLEWLTRSDLFTSSVKDAPGWYRYHHLFRQFLHAELKHDFPAEKIESLYLHASSWFESQGLLKEAISHALAGGNTKTAVAIFVRHRREITNLDDWEDLQRLLRLFPQTIINKQPELKMAEVTLFLYHHQFSQMSALLDQAEALLAKSNLAKADRARLEGEIAARRSTVAYWQGNSALSGSLAQQALEKLPKEWWQPRAQARLYLGGELQRQGKLDEALDTLLVTGEPDFGPAYQMRLLVSACFICWLAADLPQIERLSLKIIENFSGFKSNAAGVASYFMGILNYQRNDFEKAEKYLLPLDLNPQMVPTQIFMHALIALALVYQSQGHMQRVLDLWEVVRSYSQESGTPFGISDAAALEAELNLRQGDFDKAVQWAESYHMPEAVHQPYFYTPPLTYLKVLIAQNTPASRRKALQALGRLRRILTAEHQTRWLIDVLGMQAIVRHREGAKDQALKDLQKAVSLAEPGGSLRNFVDLGEPLKPLLKKLIKRGTSPDYITRILFAFDAQTHLEKNTRELKRGDLAVSQSTLGITNREWEVLQLLDKRYTNKEIAETLIISKETVHTHLAHLSEKLGVSGRRAIVQAARELGLLR